MDEGRGQSTKLAQALSAITPSNRWWWWIVTLLTPKQQVFLHQLATARSSGLPMYPMGRGVNRVRKMRSKLAAQTTLVETFAGRDGTAWIRLTSAGRAFVEATKMNGFR
jgi:hypothetical protein